MNQVSLCKLLGKKGIMLLLKLLQSNDDTKLRKMSAKLICLMAYDNEEAQQCLCSHSGFGQISGKVCINPIPLSIQESIISDPNILKQIQEMKMRGKGIQYWCYPTYTNTEDELNFPDPLTYLIGFHTPIHEKRRANMSLVPRFFIYVPNSKILEQVLKSRPGFKPSPDNKAQFKSQDWNRPVTMSEVRRGNKNMNSEVVDKLSNPRVIDEDTDFESNLIEEEKEANTGVKKMSRKLKKTMDEVSRNFKLTNKNKLDDSPKNQKKLETNIKKTKDSIAERTSRKHKLN